MVSFEIRPGIFGISINDRTTDLFEGVWPISKEGVTYNAYLIRDEKTVLIDLTKDFKTDTLLSLITEIVDPRRIDYVVVNHMEPDHTGAIKTVTQINPSLRILCTPKAKPMLEHYYGITDGVLAVEDGQTLSIGKRTLTFVHAPFVHWPETMVTYIPEEKILFSCDAFGSYGALPGIVFDDECHDLDFYKSEALRYYTNIVAKFSKPTLAAINKLADVAVDIICPSHGLIWRKNPGTSIELYRKWAEYENGRNERGVTLLFGSMYGNTERVMNHVAKGISAAGIPVDIFDVARTHTSYILPSVWVNSGIVIGAPTYEVGLFPPMACVLEEIAMKRVLNKKAAYFGSFGWRGGALAKTTAIIEPVKWELTDVFEFQGGASSAAMEKGYRFGLDFGRQIAAL